MDRVYAFNRDIAAVLKRLCGGLAGKKITAALSGGADSVCLLYVLISLSKPLGFETEAVHVNHLIRGAEADRDEEFCRALCEKLGVKLTVLRADIPAAAEREGKSLELCAREFRYRAFDRLRRERGTDFTATAHNANDKAETVLFNILRGSGLDGLRGIPERRGDIIRPLLGKTRDEILSFLCAVNASYVTDSTNRENEYTRNYLRNVLLPCARKVNPNAVGALNRLSTAASADADYLGALAEEALNAVPPRVPGTLPEALLSRAVRALCLKSCGFVPESCHVSAICAALASGGGGKRFSLPGGFTAVTCGGKLRFEKAGAAGVAKPVLESAALTEGENLFAGGAVRVELRRGACRRASDSPEKLLFSVSLDSSALVGTLYVRRRRRGDSFVVRNISRSIKKCFINKKVPAYLRDLVPVICDDGGIVYVPFVGAADRVYGKNCADACNITVVIERVGLQQ